MASYIQELKDIKSNTIQSYFNSLNEKEKYKYIELNAAIVFQKYARRVCKHTFRKSLGDIDDVVFGCRVCIDSIDNVPHCSEKNGVS